MSLAPKIDMQRPASPEENIVLIGPGGVGKSTLGARLARLSGRRLIDLDLEFCQRIAVIGPYISQHGYEAYRSANLVLAGELLGAVELPTIFVTSSGFLAAPEETSDYQQALALVRTGYGITVLPSLDVEVATIIVVERQLTRGLGMKRADEVAKFRTRFAVYRDLGDMRVVSAGPPAEIAEAVIAALGLPIAQ
jgi:shikimate kinase